MTRDDAYPPCPRCRQRGHVRATLRVSLGTYFFCDGCNHMWCVEPANRAADPSPPLLEEQMKMLRRLRRVLGIDPRPK